MAKPKSSPDSQNDASVTTPTTSSSLYSPTDKSNNTRNDGDDNKNNNQKNDNKSNNNDHNNSKRQNNDNTKYHKSNNTNIYNRRNNLQHHHRAQLTRQMTIKQLPKIEDASDLKLSINRHLFYTLLRDRHNATLTDLYTALAMSIRDQMAGKWIKTHRHNREQNSRHVYYLSMEFYLGRLLRNAITNLGLNALVGETMKTLGLDLSILYETERDAGLGNGGLGRLAACYLDSMATLHIPCYGYGIRYEYGIFEQVINEKGEQEERADNWLEMGYVWEIPRLEDAVNVHMFGHIDHNSKQWVDTQVVKAIPYDIPIPGYRNDFIGTLRLWRAKATTELSFDMFNTGDYVKAVENKNKSENLTRVLYPDDSTYIGKELRLRQEYFLVAASIRDILNRHFTNQQYANDCQNKNKNKNNKDNNDNNNTSSLTPFSPKNDSFASCIMNNNSNCNNSNLLDFIENFADKVCIQLNDTHPALAIPELLRILLDELHLSWDHAWGIVRKSFNYTNHTVLPEALEKWPVDMLERVLPRHLQIIYHINMLFLAEVRTKMKDVNDYLIEDMSLVEERGVKSIRMAYLSIVGSSKVNGVARVHSNLIKETLFKNFVKFYKDKSHFLNVTNGVTPRRWLAECNEELSELISSKIDGDWISNMKLLEELLQYQYDKPFLFALNKAKQKKKEAFAKFLEEKYQITMNTNWMLFVQVKRIHEYKRQLMNLLNVMLLFNRVKNGENIFPRTIVIGGKAAPGYLRAKKIIRLINAVAKTIDNDERANKFLKLIFLPNYDVSSAEIAIPAANVSEQISLAGTEASGTGNMKFMMNGALTIGTLDGANMEIYEAVGASNIFTFGLKIENVQACRHNHFIHRHDIIHRRIRYLADVLRQIENGYFMPHDDATYFRDLVEDLRNNDHYLILRDLADYAEKSDEAVTLYYRRRLDWTRSVLINIAKSGVFSSDVSIRNYCEKIWNVKWYSKDAFEFSNNSNDYGDNDSNASHDDNDVDEDYDEDDNNEYDDFQQEFDNNQNFTSKNNDDSSDNDKNIKLQIDLERMKN